MSHNYCRRTISLSPLSNIRRYCSASINRDLIWQSRANIIWNFALLRVRTYRARINIVIATRLAAHIGANEQWRSYTYQES